ncbi:response regulator [Turneriella parva]|uniref:histidine kinase n=1 Tax=Turneriella parva (strain ATCC BAA-1111 / DSM 21527 / NCTC 11395 / H) TaxID=869212 RepID=I4B4Y0_TURPD|nr:response regulator [Turneriella parva]AFM12337.1 multi-sensor hybrid histidine kinase [Turneriella parva DSM 21527]
MPVAPLPANEAERLEKVKSYHLLDTLAEEAFDELARFASRLCGTPVSLITLIDGKRQWFKSAVGMARPETPREQTICQHTILQNDLLEIEDSRLDSRTEDNPNVTAEPGVRHYAGIPLTTADGYNIGTFCVVDFKPGRLTELQREGFKTLARQAMRLMEFRKLSYEYKALSDRYSALYQYSPIAELVVDNEGRVVDANDAAAKLLGRQHAEIQGQRAFYEALDETSRHVAADVQTALEAKGHIEGTELKLHSAAAGLKNVMANTVVLRDESGKRVGAHITLQDITALKAIEAQLVEARALAESANRAKSDFLAVMSHEIRTPLNGMIGMVSILKESNLNDEQQRYLGIIERSGAMLMNVIGNVLDFSKLQADAMERSDTTFDLYQTLSEVYDLFSARAKEKDVELILSIDPKIPRLMISDQTKLRQIVMNLVSNALKFTDKGGVTMRVSLVEPQAAAEMLRIAVEDSGIGMSAQQLERLFKPFSQADGSISRRFGGTGLGLSIAKKLTELLGGTIDVQSTIGKGSVFSFAIPAKFDLVSEQRTEGEFVGTGFFAGRKFLLVDNLPVNLEIVQRMLESLQITVVPCENPKAAPELAQKNQFDAAILDLNMPGMNGLEVAEALKTISPKTIRILLSSIAVTRSAETENVFHHTLTKPVRREQLVYVLSRLLPPQNGTETEEIASRDVLAHQHVLIVEDDSVNQTISRITLEKFGATTDTAADGQAALDCASRRDYAFVLLDMHLPDIDGFALAEKLLKVRPSLRLVCFTADVTLVPDARLRQVGIIDKLSKPATVQDFAAFLARADWLITPVSSAQ